MDGAREDIGHLTDLIVARIDGRSTYIKRFVFVIRNADHYPPEDFDKLLKAMEESRRASFVLLARDRRNVRLAGQSRCFDYRVRVLNREEDERFVREILAVRGVAQDEAVIASLVEAGGGVPRRLTEVFEIVAGMGSASLVAIRERLDVAWAGALTARWPEIVAGTPSVFADLMPASGTDRAERVRRVRGELRWVSPRGLPATVNEGDAVDLALRRLDEETHRRLADEIARQADREGTTSEAVWTQLVETWMADRLSGEWCSVLRAGASATA